MGSRHRFFAALLTLILISPIAQSAPTIDTLGVQGYLKKANGNTVTDGTYSIAYGVFQNGTAIWGKSISTTVSNGLFSASLSGTGSDLSALSAGTGMNADFSALNLNAALLIAGGNGAISVRVYAVTAIDGSNPQFDLAIKSSPSAYVCDTAYRVVNGAITLQGLATSARTNASAGAGDANKLVALDGTGVIDITMVPSIPASKITGTIPVSQGGTGGTSAATSRASLGAAASGSNSDITALTGLSTAITLAQGGTGATTASGARTNLGAAASGSNADITALTGLSTAITLAQGGTGATTASAARTNIGAAASGANSDITSLGGLSTAISPAQGGTGQTSYSAGDTLYATGATTVSKLSVGASGAVMTSTGTAPQWSASLGAGSGGTGNTSYTAGDILYATGATSLSKLAVGTAGQVLTVNTGGTAPSWTSVSAGTAAMILFDEFLGIHGSAASTISNTFFPVGNYAAFSSAATAIVRNASIAATDVNRPGIMQLFSNAAAVAAGVAYCNLTNSAGAVTAPSINFTGGPVTMEIGVRVPVLGTGATYRIGFGSANVGTTAPTKKAYFEFVGAATGQWTYQAAGTGSNSANVGTTFAANTWMKLTITVNSAASSITFQKDADTAVVESIAANIPVASDFLCPFAVNVGTAASSRNLDIDYIKITKSFSTAR